MHCFMGKWGIWAILGFAIVSMHSLQAAVDRTPPVVDRVFPTDGAEDVPPTSIVGAVIHDPFIAEGVPGSGINRRSVNLWVSSERVSVTIVELADERLLVKAVLPQGLPESSQITIKLSAADLAGNAMKIEEWSFSTSNYPDVTPPFVMDVSPPDGCLRVTTQPQISCRILDLESGVDKNTIAMFVNGFIVPLQLSPISQGFTIFYQPDEPLPYETWVHVTVLAEDFDGNMLRESWIFQTESENLNPPELIFPGDGDLLNYQLEDGIIDFTWEFDPEHPFYRLVMVMQDYPSMEQFDLIPGDYEVEDDAVYFKYSVPESIWNQMAELGGVDWRVAKIRSLHGTPISPWSETHVFFLAPSDVVVLRTPFHESMFFDSTARPVFSWDPFRNAVGYRFGLARICDDGELIEEIVSLDLSETTTQIDFGESFWKNLDSGEYVWAVVAHLPDNSKSGFMNYYFRKERFPPLFFHNIIEMPFDTAR